MNIMDIVLEIKPVIINSTEDQQANTDWETIMRDEFNKKNTEKLRNMAKKLSLKPHIYEVHLLAQGDDDPELQEFYRKGKLKFKMF